MALTGLEIAGIAVTALSVLGAPLTFFFKYGIKLALVERTANEAHIESKQNGKDIAATNAKVNTLEVIVQQIRDSLHKLDSIDEIKASVSHTKDTVNELKEQFEKLRDRLDR
jgi:septal ring factor EnvC (AmiA/AmiB activator)